MYGPVVLAFTLVAVLLLGMKANGHVARVGHERHLPLQIPHPHTCTLTYLLDRRARSWALRLPLSLATGSRPLVCFAAPFAAALRASLDPHSCLRLRLSRPAGIFYATCFVFNTNVSLAELLSVTVSEALMMCCIRSLLINLTLSLCRAMACLATALCCYCHTPCRARRTFTQPGCSLARFPP